MNTDHVGWLYAGYGTLIGWLGEPTLDGFNPNLINAGWHLGTTNGPVAIYDHAGTNWGGPDWKADDATQRTVRAMGVTEWRVAAETVDAARAVFGDVLAEHRAGPGRHRWVGPGPTDVCAVCGMTRRWRRFAGTGCQVLAVERPAGLDLVTFRMPAERSC